MAYDFKRDRNVGGDQPNFPARNATFVGTPADDTTDLTTYAKALYIGVSGDVTIVLAGDRSTNGVGVLFKAVPVGILAVQVRRILATGTTATNIVALYDL
jgi:hypothetical protein